MTKQESRQAELDFLMRWSRAVFEYIESTVPEAQVALLAPIYGILDEAHRSKNLKGLRSIAKDLLESTSGMKEDQRAELDQQLRTRFGTGLQLSGPHARVEAAMLARILDRGTIESATEYRLILERVERLYEDESRAAEVKRLNDLLAAYHSEKVT
jgi:hypothetical protein